MMMKRLMTAVAALAIGAAVAVADEGHDHAHDHPHDHGAKHNGIVAHSGHHHLELVASGNGITLYITDEDGKEEDASNAKATATVLAGGKTATGALAPAGGNGLKGSGGFTAGKGTTVVISLTMPGHAPEQVRFKLD